MIHTDGSSFPKHSQKSTATTVGSEYRCVCYPGYRCGYRPSTHPLTYEYRKTFKTTLSELNTLSSAYALLTNSNITVVQTTFSPKNEDLIQAELMKTALENAQAKASAAMSNSKKKVGELVNVTEIVTNREQTNVLLTSDPELSSAAGPKDVEVTVNLNATFELK